MKDSFDITKNIRCKSFKDYSLTCKIHDIKTYCKEKMYLMKKNKIHLFLYIEIYQLLLVKQDLFYSTIILINYSYF